MNKHKYNLGIVMLLLMLSLTLVSASYLPHKQNTELNFSITSNFATSCELTTINSPTGIILIEQTDTSTGTFNFNVLSGNFSSLGTYCMNIVCTDGVDITSGQECREVTLNGNEPASSGIVVVFSLVFIAIISFGIVYFIKALGHVIQFEMDIIDTAVLMSTYFAMWFFYYFAQTYMGNPLINNILEIAIDIGAITHVFLALVGFLVSFIMTNLKFKQKARITY